MKNNFVNSTIVEGYLYNHKLEKRITGEKSKNPGTPYISGSIDIATDAECVNVVSIYYTYVVETTSKGSTNPTFITLSNIIDGKLNTVMNSGVELAALVKAESAIGLNEFYAKDDSLVSQRRNIGGFIHSIKSLNPDCKLRNKWIADMVITNCFMKEADEEKDIAEHLVLKGCIFNFRKELLPVEVVAYRDDAIQYFTGLNISEKNPVFTNIWGQQLSQTKVKTTTIESAFGEPQIQETRSTYREFVVDGAKTEPYEWDDESTLTINELTEMTANREIYLADLKMRAEQWRNTATTATAAKPGDFRF